MWPLITGRSATRTASGRDRHGQGCRVSGGTLGFDDPFTGVAAEGFIGEFSLQTPLSMSEPSLLDETPRLG
jgi:hypothetical protein